MFKFGILGGGFGIYGYLPAVHELGFEILLLSRYKETVVRRVELREYLPKIRFCASEEELIAASDFLVFARTPLLQYHFILRNLKELSLKKHVFLEKPLTANSQQTNKLLELFTQYNIRFSIAYLFGYSKWFKEISNASSNSFGFRVQWRIPVVESDWKNNSALGGGPLRFYGIHFFPLLFELGIDLGKIRVKEEILSFRIEAFGRFILEIDGTLVDKNPFFSVTELSTDTLIFSESTPFGQKPTIGRPDPRIPIIKEYLESELSAQSPIEKKILTEKKLDTILNC